MNHAVFCALTVDSELAMAHAEVAKAMAMKKLEALPTPGLALAHTMTRKQALEEPSLKHSITITAHLSANYPQFRCR